MDKATTTIAVIPAYNEEETIAQVIRQVQIHVQRIIVVNDGSLDKTTEILASLGIECINNNKNVGKGPSLLRGFQAALRYSPDFILTLDADGQHRPEEIPRLLEAAHMNPGSIIIGIRKKNRAQAPKIRLFANRFADFWVSWASGYPVQDSQSGFRLYPASFLKELRLPTRKGKGFVLESEILIVASRKEVYSHGVEVQSIYHAHGRSSHYRPVLDTLFITLMIAGKLLARGMNLPGLLRTLHLLTAPRNIADNISGNKKEP